jgi:hypothetical protein
MTSRTDLAHEGPRLAIDDRIDSILAASHELADYRSWLGAGRPNAPGPRDYLFTRDIVRFEPRRGDVPVAAPGLRVASSGGVTRLICPAPAADIELADVSAQDAERLVEAIDGERCLVEVLWDADVEPAVGARLLRAAFGRVIFAPAAVEELEQRVAGIELCRFPSSPYALERPYWENMIGVRARFLERAAEAVTAPSLVRLLRELHVVALLGPRLDSFYRPASPGADRAAPPGALLLDPPRLLRGQAHAVFLDGPRVNASLVGGRRYHQAVAASVGDVAALDDGRAIELDDLDWGRVALARGEADGAAAAWFCPPRPLSPAHFDWLAASLHDAGTTSVGQPTSPPDPAAADATVRATARWHWGFVRLHPFHCANQSLAMNIANALLGAAVGAGIPHLLLDHFALRLSLAGYERLFARAVRHWAVAEADPVHRLTLLLEQRARLFSLLEATSRRSGSATPRALAGEDQAAACAALLCD